MEASTSSPFAAPPLPSDYDAVASALASLISSVPNSGLVHKRYRYAADWPAFLSAFAYSPDPGSPSIIRGWMMSRMSIEPVDEASSFGHITRLHMMRLYFVTAFSDAEDSPSEPGFQSVLESVLAKLESDRGIFGLGEITDSLVVQGVGFATVNPIEIRQFGRVLCHYAEVNVPCPLETAITQTAY